MPSLIAILLSSPGESLTLCAALRAEEGQLDWPRDDIAHLSKDYPELVDRIKEAAQMREEEYKRQLQSRASLVINSTMSRATQLPSPVPVEHGSDETQGVKKSSCQLQVDLPSQQESAQDAAALQVNSDVEETREPTADMGAQTDMETTDRARDDCGHPDYPSARGRCGDDVN